MLSNFGSTAQGTLGNSPEAVALLAGGDALVLDPDAQPPGGGLARGLLFRVNLATGARAVLSNFSSATQGPLGVGARVRRRG